MSNHLPMRLTIEVQIVSFKIMSVYLLSDWDCYGYL
jgi:hypothetical protein